MRVVPEITREMLAAGLEAKHEGETDCLTEEDLIREIFWAMIGKSYFDPEVLH